MSLAAYIFLATSSLFVIVDPLAVLPAFIAMTPNDSPAERTRMAKIACMVVAGVLLVFGYGGQWVFHVLGITLPAFQMAASITLLLVALDMLRAQRSRVQETSEEMQAGAEKTDIAVTPLAIPMLSGPGAISTVILLQAQAKSFVENVALGGCIVLVSAACYVILRMAAHGAKWLSPIALRISTRIMGLLLASLAVQFMLNAIQALRASW